MNASFCRGDCSSSILTGSFCEEWGLFEPSGPCQAGYYCIAGTLPQWRDASTSSGEKVVQQHMWYTANWILCIWILFKVSTFPTRMVISVLEWEEPVRRGATVPRAPVCHGPAPGGRTRTGWQNINTRFKRFLGQSLTEGPTCVVLVFILPTSWAAVRARRVTTVATWAWLTPLDCAKRGSTARVETVQPQVDAKHVISYFYLGFKNKKKGSLNNAFRIFAILLSLLLHNVQSNFTM